MASPIPNHASITRFSAISSESNSSKNKSYQESRDCLCSHRCKLDRVSMKFLCAVLDLDTTIDRECLEQGLKDQVQP